MAPSTYVPATGNGRSAFKARTHKRPDHGIEIRSWYPKYQEWLTLDEYTCLCLLNDIGQKSLDTTDVEIVSSGPSERIVKSRGDLNHAHGGDRTSMSLLGQL